MREDIVSGSTGEQARIGVFYPSDPLGSIPGGIETFIRGLIQWAPDDLRFAVVGVTTDRSARPVGRWSECAIGGRTFDHYPLFAIDDPGRQSKIPATVTYMLRLMLKSSSLHRSFDVLDFHRIEPAAVFPFDRRPRNTFIHQNMEVIHSRDSDIRWKYLPGLYRRLEDFLMRRMASVYVVRDDAARTYRERYPDIADRFRFTPTWMDPTVFYPVSDEQRQGLRQRLFGSGSISATDTVLVSVGRLDTQKDPLLLIDAFARLQSTRVDTVLVLIGDGILRQKIEQRARELGVAQRVVLAGLLQPAEVSDYLRAADLFVLSSAYEGMPMSVLEAMGCGLPVVTTRVGEVHRVVNSGRNGMISKSRDVSDFTDALETALGHLTAWRGAPCLEAAADYVPAKVLAPIYANYRRLAGRSTEQ